MNAPEMTLYNEMPIDQDVNISPRTKMGSYEFTARYLLADAGLRFDEFKEQARKEARFLKRIASDLRPDRLWSRFWSEKVPPAQRSLIALYALRLAAVAPDFDMNMQQDIADELSAGPQNPIVYQMPADSDTMAYIFDPRHSTAPLGQDDDPGHGDPKEGKAYVPIGFVNTDFEDLPTPAVAKPSATPSATASSEPTDTPTPVEPTPTHAPPSVTPTPSAQPDPSATPFPEFTPTPRPEINPETDFTRETLLQIQDMRNVDASTANENLFTEHWHIAGSWFEDNGEPDRGRCISFTAESSQPDVAEPQSTKPAAISLRLNDDFNDVFGTLTFEDGRWNLDGDPLNPDGPPESSTAKLYYYLDGQGNLIVQIHSAGNVISSSKIAFAESQDYNPYPHDRFGIRVGLPAGGGYIRDITVERLTDPSIQTPEEPEQKPLPLKERLNQAGSGRLYLFAGAALDADPMPGVEPIDSEIGLTGMGDHKILKNPRIIDRLKEGEYHGIVWRDADDDDTLNMAGKGQVEAMARFTGAEVFLSTEHQFRMIPSRVFYEIRNSRDRFKTFTEDVKKRTQGFMRRSPVNADVNPIVVALPLSPDGEPRPFTTDPYNYPYAFRNGPSSANAMGEIIQFAHDAAPKGAHGEHKRKFGVYEYMGITSPERREKLIGLFVGNDIPQVPLNEGNVVLIIDEPVDPRKPTPPEIIDPAPIIADQQTSNPHVRFMVVLRPRMDWKNIPDAQLPSVVDGSLELMFQGKIDLAMDEEIAEDPYVQRKIDEFLNSNEGTGEPTPIPVAVPTPRPAPTP